MSRHIAMTLKAVAVVPLALMSPNLAAAQSDSWSAYLEPAALSERIATGDEVQIIDIRSSKYVKRGIIPGAVWIPFPEWRGDKERPGQVPTEEELEAMLGANGIDPNKPIVIYNHAAKTVQTGRSAIVYWILKSAGAEDIAILNGGFKAWAGMSYPEAEAPIAPTPVSVDITYTEEWWADAMDIFAVTSGQVDGAILDARLDAQVRKSVETGEPMMSMPMAQYVPASLFTNPMSSSRLTAEGQADFIAELTDRGIDPGDGFLISVCQTGELSALSWFYASEILQLEDVRYYPDALKGWEGDGGLMFGMRTQ